jgi:ribulose bisphosphate carboxylase small subunit
MYSEQVQSKHALSAVRHLKSPFSKLILKYIRLIWLDDLEKKVLLNLISRGTKRAAFESESSSKGIVFPRLRKERN